MRKVVTRIAMFFIAVAQRAPKPPGRQGMVAAVRFARTQSFGQTRSVMSGEESAPSLRYDCPRGAQGVGRGFIDFRWG